MMGMETRDDKIMRWGCLLSGLAVLLVVLILVVLMVAGAVGFPVR